MNRKRWNRRIQTSPVGSIDPRYRRISECFSNASEIVASLHRPTTKFFNDPNFLALSIWSAKSTPPKKTLATPDDRNNPNKPKKMEEKKRGKGDWTHRWGRRRWSWRGRARVSRWWRPWSCRTIRGCWGEEWRRWIGRGEGGRGWLGFEGIEK